MSPRQIGLALVLKVYIRGLLNSNWLVCLINKNFSWNDLQWPGMDLGQL